MTARVGSTSAGSAAATSFPQTPTAGNYLVLVVVSTRTLTVTTDPTINQTWDGVVHGTDVVTGTGHYKVSIFYKKVVGGETAPTITATNLDGWAMQELSGLVSKDSNSASVGDQNTTRTTSITPTGAKTFEFTALAKANTEAVTWSNGATGNSGPHTGTSYSIFIAYKAVTGTSASSNTATWTTSIQSTMLTAGFVERNNSNGCGIGSGNGVMTG